MTALIESDHGAANDRQIVSLSGVGLLIREIERLTAEVGRLESRVSELQLLAYLDPLVNLPNRRYFLSSLSNLIARTERYGGDAAMLFVDVDGLKQINDEFGHGAGDESLVEISKILSSVCRDSDCVARIGGDEFGILLEGADELGAWNTALRIVEATVGAQFCVKQICLPLSVAVGVTTIGPADIPQKVIDRADEAMYRIKSGSSLATTG